MPILDVARTAPRGTEAIGVPVATSGPVPRTIGLGRAALGRLGFEGKVGQVLTVPGGNGAVVVAVGIGEPAAVTPAVLRRAAGAFARATTKAATAATSLTDVAGVEARAAGQAVAEGIVLGSYRYLRFKSDAQPPALERVTLLCGAGRAAAVATGAARGAAIADAVALARDLANAPPDDLTAEDLADAALAAGSAAGLEVEVFGADAIAELRLGGLLGVNRGSTRPPRLVRMTYTPRRPEGTVALVGKGITFDSGGLSLKTSDGMMQMKLDMTGAAVVLGTLTAVAATRPRVKVVGYLCCTDNMPSGSSMKLGDVLTIRNGTTVEIHNTDAEGRLVLADGLALAVDDGADAIIDIATLTGACVVALGTKMAGLMGNDDGWTAQVRAAAERADEPVWPLPLPADYRKLLDSEVADMKNVGGPHAGALVAGLFLKEFVAGVPWAHLDIAGPMRSDADEGWLTKGATAFGLRTLVELLDRVELPGASGSVTRRRAAPRRRPTRRGRPAPGRAGAAADGR